MKHETENQQMTDRHADDLLLSGMEDESLDDNHRMHPTHSGLPRIIDSAMLRNEENMLMQLRDRVTKNSMNTSLTTTDKEAITGILSHRYGAVEDIVKHIVVPGEAGNTSTPRFKSFTDSQGFAGSMVECLIKRVNIYGSYH